jgi:integrase
MAIYRRGEEWWYHFWFDGQHFQEYANTKNKRQARRAEARHKAELLLGVRKIESKVEPPVKPPVEPTTESQKNPRFADFAVPYLAFSKANKRSYGVEVYYVNATLVPFFGQLRLSEISALKVEEFKQKRLEDGLKKSSINREVGLLKSMLETGLEWELTRRNAARKAKLFVADDPESDRVLSYEEEGKLLAACATPELRYRAPHLMIVILIALYTGLRRGEILRLRWEHIDFQHGMLTVRKSKTRSGKRAVNLNAELRQMLALLHEQRHSEWVFPSPKRFQKPGESERHIEDVKNAFRRAVRLSRIAPITFHQLRHTFCSRLGNAGVPMPVIQELAGHASITMTRHYTHPADERKQKAVEGLLRGRDVTKSATEADKIESGTLGVKVAEAQLRAGQQHKW